MAEPKQYAFFDFDGTLSRGDSILPYLMFCFREKKITLPQLSRAVGAFVDYALKIHDGTRAKEIALSFLEGKTREEMELAAQRFYEEKLSRLIFPQGAWELKKCQEAGLETVIVTASPDLYLEPVKKRLGVSGIIATCCGLKEERFTGRLASPNVYGEEKVTRIRAYLREQGHEDALILRAYGNTPGDLPMLKMAREPVVVNGGAKLKQALPQARQENWK